MPGNLIVINGSEDLIWYVGDSKMDELIQFLHKIGKQKKQKDSMRISQFEKQGHTYHCACRLVWGDGECECGMKGKKPPTISQMVLKSTGHHD